MGYEQTQRTLVGSHEFSTLFGDEAIEQGKQLTNLAPALGRALVEDAHGNILANATTSYRQWSLQALALLTAMGDPGEQGDLYLKAALLHGATEEEVLDVLNFVALYSGMPRAITGTRRIASYLAEGRGKHLAGATEQVVQLQDHQTMVWDSRGKGLPGEGVPMLLIHALNMDHRFWREVFPVLAARGRTVAYDIRGHGYARGGPLSTSLDQMAEDVRCLADRLGIGIFDVYGASYGGAIAQHVALAMPERVRSMALLATWAEVPHEEHAARATDAEQHGMEAQVAKSMIRWFLPETIAQNLWMVRYARSGIRRTRVEEWAAAWRTMSTLKITEQMADPQRPVLVLSGKQDLSATPDVMQALAKVYENSEFVSVDPGTHMMAMEQPEPVAAALVRFRDKVELQFRLP